MINITSTKYLDLKNGKFNIDKAGVVGDSNSRYLKIKIENLSDDVRVDLICKVSENVYVSHAEKIKGHYLVKFPNEVFRNEGIISFQIKVSDDESTVFSDIMTANISKSLVLDAITESDSEDFINFDKLVELSKIDIGTLNSSSNVDVRSEVDNALREILSPDAIRDEVDRALRDLMPRGGSSSSSSEDESIEHNGNIYYKVSTLDIAILFNLYKAVVKPSDTMYNAWDEFRRIYGINAIIDKENKYELFDSSTSYEYLTRLKYVYANQETLNKLLNVRNIEFDTLMYNINKKFESESNIPSGFKELYATDFFTKVEIILLDKGAGVTSEAARNYLENWINSNNLRGGAIDTLDTYNYDISTIILFGSDAGSLYMNRTSYDTLLSDYNTALKNKLFRG